jgi:hypothetical protein
VNQGLPDGRPFSFLRLNMLLNTLALVVVILGLLLVIGKEEQRVGLVCVLNRDD